MDRAIKPQRRALLTRSMTYIVATRLAWSSSYLPPFSVDSSPQYPPRPRSKANGVVREGRLENITDLTQHRDRIIDIRLGIDASC